MKIKKPKYLKFYCETHLLYRLITAIRTRQPMNCKNCKKSRDECSRQYNEYLDKLEEYHNAKDNDRVRR